MSHRLTFLHVTPNSVVHRRTYSNILTSTRRRRREDTKTVASAHNYTTLLTIPTGIGASIGGYAGDALPTARLLSTVTDTLITHPNVLNGALMYWPIPNALYVEGFALDSFCCGNINLRPITNKSNKIGLLLDSAMSESSRIRHLQAADAARATLGLQISKHTITEHPIGVGYSQSRNGASWGTIRRPDTLIKAAKRLRDAGCDAIAVIAEFPDEESDLLAEYRAGTGVDAIAGAEAVISHLVSKHVRIPCAHAPSLSPLDVDISVSPKACAEELGYTFLSCVLVGLSRAPHLLLPNAESSSVEVDILRSKDIDACIIPARAFGGAGVMELAARDDILVVAVTSNETVVDVSPRSVGICDDRVVMAGSYAEAAGFVAAHRAGIDLSSLTSTVKSVSGSLISGG